MTIKFISIFVIIVPLRYQISSVNILIEDFFIVRRIWYRKSFILWRSFIFFYDDNQTIKLIKVSQLKEAGLILNENK